MARALRIEAEGLSYHVWARGNGGMAIYVDDRDRSRFVELLGRSVASHGVACHAYCLMTTHYHVVITTNHANLSHTIQQVNSRYAQWWNHCHFLRGHVFQGRFGAQVIQDEPYLLTACRYIVLNPVRAGMVATPEQWPWSSYRATAGFDDVPPFLHPEMLWDRLGSADLEGSARRYREFVGSDDRPTALPTDVILGDQDFVQRFKSRRNEASREVPKRDRTTRAPLDHLFDHAFTGASRAASASMAYLAGYSLTEIAAVLGVHYTTVSKMIARAAPVGSHA